MDIRLNYFSYRFQPSPPTHPRFKSCWWQRFLVGHFSDVCFKKCWLFLASLGFYDGKSSQTSWFTAKTTFKQFTPPIPMLLSSMDVFHLLSLLNLVQVLIFCQYINTLDMLEARCLETATVLFGLFPLPSLIGNMFGGWVDMWVFGTFKTNDAKAQVENGAQNVGDVFF